MKNLISIPIWFNVILKTKFDIKISKAGFNFVKDLFPENQQVTKFNGLRNVKIRKLRNIVDKIPQVWRDKIENTRNIFTTVIPHQKINLQKNDQFFRDIKSKKIYQKLIEKKIRPPIGLSHWFEDFDLDESDILNGFTYAHKCSISTFDRVFQYKIRTQILPTNQYLTRYHVKNSVICSKCDLLPDTVSHSLWSCQLLVPYVDRFIHFVKQNCKVQDNIGFVEFMFGFKTNVALNHIFLEFKKEVFYNFDKNVGVDTFCERVINKVRKNMIKEKNCIKSDQMHNHYVKKWDQFTSIYDFRGPDLNII